MKVKNMSLIITSEEEEIAQDAYLKYVREVLSTQRIISREEENEDEDYNLAEKWLEDANQNYYSNLI